MFNFFRLSLNLFKYYYNYTTQIYLIISMIPKMVLATENQNKSSQLGDIIEEGNYIITSKQSNKAIEVANYGGDNGDLIQQWTYGGSTHQQWVIQKNRSGFYKIVSKISGKVIQVKNSSLDDEVEIEQNDYLGEDNQLWYFEKDSEGYYEIKSKQSGKCLDVSGMSTDNGVKLQIWSDCNGNNQKWKIEKSGEIDEVNSEYTLDINNEELGLSLLVNGTADAVTTTNISKVEDEYFVTHLVY